MNGAAALARSALLWAIAGVLAVAVSLPVLWAVSGAVGLGQPPLGGVLLLGASVALAFALGGLLGAAVGAAGSRRSGCAPALSAAAAVLVLGGLLCSALLPLYTSSVLDSLTREGRGSPYAQRDTVLRDRRLPRAREAIEAARKLRGAARPACRARAAGLDVRRPGAPPASKRAGQPRNAGRPPGVGTPGMDDLPRVGLLARLTSFSGPRW